MPNPKSSRSKTVRGGNGVRGGKGSTRRKTAGTKSTAAANNAASKGTASKAKGSGKRDLVQTPTGSFYAHRDGQGQFTELDEVGRSLAADRRQKAKTKVKSGYGDRGDR